MAKVHMLILVGGGDTYIHLVDQEVWDWIDSPLPEFQEGTYSAEDTNIPESIKARRTKDGETEPFKVSSGSPYNDRALACPMNMFDEIVINHFDMTMKGMVNIALQLREHGYEIGETYEGAVY